ncbi:6-bladed beta-propeller [Bacteroides fragilis]|uniref:6-bladed beta-propeller n=1 Tax=Bacteroides fragilis TaxID=817 RepID=UPI000F00E3F5|nr:6-bladed beta-propeller [Bacteroides fragilis]RHD47039.1 6-bladed beta-propeller [Bacteroides fragilis]
MKKLYLLFALGALVACTGSPQKEKPASVNTPAEPFGGLPVFDLQGQYPKKEIILQDLADVRYVALETGDSSLVGTRPILMTDSLIVTVNKKSDVIFFDKSGKYLHSFNHTGMSGEEYGDIVSGYCIDEKAREIFIYDGLQSRIQVYGYGGAYRRTLKLPKNRMFVFSIFEYDENFLFGEDYLFVDSQDGKYPVNKTPYYKISKKDGKLTSIPITLKERIRDGLSYMIGDLGASVGLFMSPVARLGSDILIADYSLDTAYVYRDDHLIPLTVRRNHTSENNIPILATVDVMTGRYLLWYTIVKDIDVKNNHVSDPVTYLYDRFTNEYCRVDLVNRDVVSATNIPAFQMRLSANYHVVPENYAIQYYPAEELIELNGQGKLKGELKEIASKLNDEDNPVLLIAKFKE